MELFTESSAGADGLGVSQNDSLVETYATLQVLDLSSLQGPIGQTGSQGATGDAGLAGIAFTFDTDTNSGADSDAGDVRLSSGTLNAATEMMIDDVNVNSVGIQNVILGWDDPDSAIDGYVTLQAPRS